MSTRDVLREKMGVCREYVKIFSEMCDIAGYRVKCIRGFAKGPNYIPGKCTNLLLVLFVFHYDIKVPTYIRRCSSKKK